MLSLWLNQETRGYGRKLFGSLASAPVTDEAPWPGTVMPTPGDAGEASGSSPPSLISALLPLFSLASPGVACAAVPQGTTAARRWEQAVAAICGDGVRERWRGCRVAGMRACRTVHCCGTLGGAVVQRRYRRHSRTGGALPRGGAAAAAGGAPGNEGRAPGMVRVGVDGGGYVSPAAAARAVAAAASAHVTGGGALLRSGDTAVVCRARRWRPARCRATRGACR
eukprot:SAG25_NODE_53_length_18703_cov_126.779104_3_plen_224_part_00